MNWQGLGWISGAVLLGVAGQQAVWAVVANRRRLRAARVGYSRRQQEFHGQLQAVMQWARAAKPMFEAWPGTRPFRVADVVNETVDCKSYYLMPVDGHPLPRFEPGQFLTFCLPVDLRKKPLSRCYSLSDQYHEDYYRVTIKHALPPVGEADLPAGVGSSYFHQQVQVGTTLEVKAPRGAFFLDPTDHLPVVLIGAGIGITPIFSVASALAAQRSRRTAYVFGGFRNSREHPFRESLQQLAAECERIELDISYSRPMPADQIGRDYDQRGYVDVARLKQILPSSNFRFYLCGPPAMMETLVPGLRTWGVPESHIHFEAFGLATVKKVKQKPRFAASAEQPCQVDFSLTKTSLTWDGSCESLLEFAESQGVSLDSGCRAGNCGQCLVSVRSGSVEHLKEPGLPLEKHECLTCIGVPSGDVVLEA